MAYCTNALCNAINYFIQLTKLRLKKDEMELLHSSAAAVKEIMDALDKMNLDA